MRDHIPIIVVMILLTVLAVSHYHEEQWLRLAGDGVVALACLAVYFNPLRRWRLAREAARRNPEPGE